MFEIDKIHTMEAEFALGLLRIVVAFLYIQHATAKFLYRRFSMTDGNGSIVLFLIISVAGMQE